MGWIWEGMLRCLRPCDRRYFTWGEDSGGTLLECITSSATLGDLLPGLSCPWSTGERREVSVFITPVLSSRCPQRVLAPGSRRGAAVLRGSSSTLDSRERRAVVTTGPSRTKGHDCRAEANIAQDGRYTVI